MGCFFLYKKLFLDFPNFAQWSATGSRTFARMAGMPYRANKGGFLAELCFSFCPVKSKKCLRDSIKNYSGNLRLYGKKIEDPLKIKALITLKVLMIFVQAESYF